MVGSCSDNKNWVTVGLSVYSESWVCQWRHLEWQVRLSNTTCLSVLSADLCLYISVYIYIKTLSIYLLIVIYPYDYIFFLFEFWRFSLILYRTFINLSFLYIRYEFYILIQALQIVSSMLSSDVNFNTKFLQIYWKIFSIDVCIHLKCYISDRESEAEFKEKD